jgi:ribosome-binding factor A
MTRRRVKRFNQLLREELSDLLFRRVRDPRLSSITITEVDTTADLRIARVYISLLEDDEETRQDLLKTIQGAAGFLRRELAGVLDVRHTPELDFRLDNSAQYGEHIEQLLEQIRREDQPPTTPQDAG